MPKFVRREVPPAFTNYANYRPYLERVFLNRCCYCGMREALGHSNAFHIEHFKPKTKFPELINVYSNLYYACFRCNRFKSSYWPNEVELASGKRFWDPCEDLSCDHFSCTPDDGKIHAKTACGTFTITKVRLDRPFLNKIRSKRIERQKKFRDTLTILRGLKENLAKEPTNSLLAEGIEKIEEYLGMLKNEMN